jgi:hypothetical protein
MDAFPTLATWDSYTLEVDYNGGTVTGPCAQLYRGGIAQLSPCLPLPVPSTATKTLALVLGDVAGGQFKQGSVNLELDNVTFDIK